MREPTTGEPTDRPDTDLPDGIEMSQATGWVAWILLGGVFLVLLGALHLGMGLVALWHPEILAAGRSDRLLDVGDDALAIVHLLLGAVAATTGVGLIRGRRWARRTTVVLAGAAGMINFVVVSAHPAWSVTALVLAVLVIYSTVAHGAEMAEAYAA